MRTFDHLRTLTMNVVHLAPRNALWSALVIPLLITACGGPRSGPDSDPTAGHNLSAEELQLRVNELALKSQEAPSQPYWPFHVAELYVGAQRPAEAKAHLQLALAVDQDYAPALSLLCKLHYESGEHATAIELLEGARQRMGTAFPAALAAGLALHYQASDHENTDSLFADLESSADHHGTLTYHLLASDGFLAARPWAESAVSRQPQSAANRNNLGITLLYEGYPEEAREEFEEALALNPDLPGPMYNLAIVEHFYFFDTDTGRDWLDRYLKLSDYDPDGLQEIFTETESAR